MIYLENYGVLKTPSKNKLHIQNSNKQKKKVQKSKNISFTVTGKSPGRSPDKDSPILKNTKSPKKGKFQWLYQ